MKLLFTAEFWAMVLSLILALAFLPGAVDTNNPQYTTHAFISVMNVALAVWHGFSLRHKLIKE